MSKLAGCGWIAERAYMPGLADVTEDACYRAMGVLMDILPDLQEPVLYPIAIAIASSSAGSCARTARIELLGVLDKRRPRSPSR